MISQKALVMSRQRAPQSIGIDFTAKCNARCDHCCVSSAPDAEQHLTDDQVDNIITEALQLPEVREIGFTGGELMLYRPRLLHLIQRVTSSGRSATLVTNGFWAVTPKMAAKVVDELFSAGLRSLTISYDDFHSPYVSSQRIRNALDAIAPTAMQVILNMAVSKEQNSFALLEGLGDSTLGVQVTRFPVLPAGQAKMLPERVFQRHPLTSKDLRCPGYELIFHHDGLVYPCCSPAVFDTQLTVGRVGEHSVDSFIDLVERNLLLAIIQREGFGWFLSHLEERGVRIEGFDATEVVSACELCLRLFRDRSVVDALREDIAEYGRRLVA